MWQYRHHIQRMEGRNQAASMVLLFSPCLRGAYPLATKAVLMRDGELNVWHMLLRGVLKSSRTAYNASIQIRRPAAIEYAQDLLSLADAMHIIRDRALLERIGTGESGIPHHKAFQKAAEVT